MYANSEATPNAHRCQASSEATVSTISRGPNIAATEAGAERPGAERVCANFLYGFKAAPRAARAAASAPRPSLSLTLHSGRANAGRLARKAKYLGAAINRVSSPGRVGI